MTTLHEQNEQTPSAQTPADAPAEPVATRDPYKLDFVKTGADRRDHRRHDLEQQSIGVSRWHDQQREPQSFGRLVDLSAGGVRIRATRGSVQPDARIRLRLELPAYAGISPFITTADGSPRATREWVGHMEVARVRPVAGRDEVEVAGRLVDMADTDRGMLGLYLSTQPLAA